MSLVSFFYEIQCIYTIKYSEYVPDHVQDLSAVRPTCRSIICFSPKFMKQLSEFRVTLFTSQTNKQTTNGDECITSAKTVAQEIISKVMSLGSHCSA